MNALTDQLAISSNVAEQLRIKLSNKDAVIGVIGLGYVGLPLINTIHSSGFSVVGFDLDNDKIQKLVNGISYIHHIKSHIITELSISSRFTATSNFDDLRVCDVFIMCLPTPVGSHNEPDMSYVLSTTKRIVNVLKESNLVILESTTYPGATDTDLVNILEESGMSCGKQFFVAYSPEREDPGNKEFETCTIPKLVGGVNKDSGLLAKYFYEQAGFEKAVCVSSARVAECAKLLENIYRAVNIALVNELKQVFENMDVNIWEVLDAAETKPFGFHRFNPGPGIGGHCIPVDPFYLTWKSKEVGIPCNFIELAALVNSNMPSIIVNKTQQALNEYSKSVKGSKILLLGIAYKPNVDDMREAPSLVIWEHLLDLGAKVSYYDPFLPQIGPTRKHPRLTNKQSVNLSLTTVEKSGFDATVLVTDHDCFEGYEFLSGFKGPVIDTRNVIPKSLGVNIVIA